MKNKNDRPDKIKTPTDEVEALLRLKDTQEWQVVKRVAVRYIQNLKSISFKLTEENPAYLAARHAELAGQALGIKQLIKFIDESGKRASRDEKNQ